MKILINKNSSEENTAIYMMESSGAAFCMLSYYEAEKHIMYLSNLNVSENMRNIGFGKTMIQYAIQRARMNGCKYLYLNVVDKNSWIYEWYKRLGFVEYRSSNNNNGCDMFLEL